MELQLKEVIYKETEGISIISLNRPNKLNAITSAMGKEILTALNAARESDTKVVILKGEGRSFSAGADLREVRSIETMEGHRASIQQLQDMARVIMNLDKPIISAIQGPVVAGGLELALDADFIIAADDADMFCSEPGFGGMVTNAAHQIIPRLIGLSRAKEMILLGKHVDAKTALEWGLVNQVVPRDKLDEATMDMARKIVAQPRIAVKLCRIMLNYGYEMSFGAMLELELSNSCTSHSSEEHKAGVAGMVSKL